MSEVITIADPSTGSTASILPSLGFNCFSFRPVIDGRAIETLWAEPDFGPQSRPSRSGIPILFPFAGRLRGTSFSFDGKTYEVTGSSMNDGNAIHGFVMGRPWRVIEQSENVAKAEFHASIDDPSILEQWPADFRIRVSYHVTGTTLSCLIEISNPDTRPLPFVFGTHPYFRVPLGGAATAPCQVTVPAASYWESAAALPTGALLPVDASRDLRAGPQFGNITIDAALANLVLGTDGRFHARIADPAGFTLEESWDSAFRECIVFTPVHREAIAIEPYTGVPNPFELTAQGIDAGLRVLRPGEHWSGRIEIALRRP